MASAGKPFAPAASAAWVLVVLLGLLGGVGTAQAATAVPRHHGAAAPAPPPPSAELDALLKAFPGGLTPEQLDAVVGTADPAAARAALRELLARQTPPAPPALDAESELEHYAHEVDEAAVGLLALPQQIGARTLPDGRATRPFWSFVLRVLPVIGAAILAGLLVRRWLDGLGRSDRPERRRVHRLLADLGGLVAYTGTLALLYVIVRPRDPAAPVLMESLLYNGALVFLVVAACRLLLAPDRPELRLLRLDDATARTLFRVLLTSIVLIVLPAVVTALLLGRGGHPDGVAAVAIALGLLPFGYFIMLVVRYRKALAGGIARRLDLADQRSGWLTLTPVLLVVYIVGLYLLVADAALHNEPSILARAVLSLVILLAVPLLGRWAELALGRFYGREESAVAAAPAASHDEHGPVPLASARPTLSAAEHVRRLMRAVWVVLAVGVVLLTAWLWGFRPEQVGMGDLFLRLLLNIGVILLLGYVGWALFQRWIDRRLELARSDEDATRAQRLQTLLPLFRAFVRVTLVAILAMIALSSLGIEIGPLLAGAGVVGIAIGLGAQQTIADILAGVFFLLEDSFRMGDYIEVGNIRGTVEGISLRSLKLRHQRGALHTLPFGRIQALTNYTRDWSLMRLELRLEPDTDVALVKKLVKKIGQELADDPEYGPGFIDPPKSQGVRNVEDNAIIVGIKYITRPGKQFTVRREVYHRLLKAFRENNVQLVGRGVVVKVESAEKVPPEAVEAAIGAAAGSVVHEKHHAA